MGSGQIIIEFNFLIIRCLVRAQISNENVFQFQPLLAEHLFSLWTVGSKDMFQHFAGARGRKDTAIFLCSIYFFTSTCAIE